MEKVKNLISKFINLIMDFPFLYMRKLKAKSTLKIFKKLRGKAGISVRVLNLRRFFTLHNFFMFNKNTKIQLCDNSGAKIIKCIHSYDNCLEAGFCCFRYSY